jgi:hypothetical protein
MLVDCTKIWWKEEVDPYHGSSTTWTWSEVQEF